MEVGVKCHAPAALSGVMSPFCTINRRLRGPQNLFEKRKNIDNNKFMKKKKKKKEKKKKMMMMMMMMMTTMMTTTTMTAPTVTCSKSVTFIYVILKCLGLYALCLRLT